MIKYTIITTSEKNIGEEIIFPLGTEYKEKIIRVDIINS